MLKQIDDTIEAIKAFLKLSEALLEVLEDLVQKECMGIPTKDYSESTIEMDSRENGGYAGVAINVKDGVIVNGQSFDADDNENIEAINQLINQNRGTEAYNECSCHGDCICRSEYDEDCEADQEEHICTCTHEDQCDNCKCKKGLTEGEKFLKRIQNVKATFVE